MDSLKRHPALAPRWGWGRPSHHISIRSGAKATVMRSPVDDGSGTWAARGGFRPGGVHRLQAGFRGPGYPPRSPPAKALLLRCYFRLRGGFRPGWLPKNSALSLAIWRAQPSRIRKCPGRNQKLPGGSAWPCLAPGWTPVRIPGSRGNPVRAPARQARGSADHRASRPAAGRVPAPAS